MLKDFLQSIIHSLPVGVSVKDANDQFRYLFYNKKANDFYKEEKEVKLGKNDYELDSPVARQYREEDEKALESETPLVFDRVMYDKETKSYRFGVATKSRLIRDDGSRYIITTIADMTDLHKKETELDNIRNELSIALDAGSLSAWIYDVEEAKFMSLYSNTLSDGSPNPDVIQHMAHPESRADLDQFMEALLSGREPKRRGVFRFMRNSTDGTKRTPSPRNHPVRDASCGSSEPNGTSATKSSSNRKKRSTGSNWSWHSTPRALRRGLTTSRTTNLPLRAINRYCTDTGIRCRKPCRC